MSTDIIIADANEFAEIVRTGTPRKGAERKLTLKEYCNEKGLEFLDSVYRDIISVFPIRRNPFIAAAVKSDTGLLVGYAAVSSFKNGINEQPRDALTAIAVRNTHRGRGIASALLEKVADECIRRHNECDGVVGPPVLSLSSLEDDGFHLIPVLERIADEHPGFTVIPSYMNDRDERFSGLKERAAACVCLPYV